MTNSWQCLWSKVQRVFLSIFVCFCVISTTQLLSFMMLSNLCGNDIEDRDKRRRKCELDMLVNWNDGAKTEFFLVSLTILNRWMWSLKWHLDSFDRSSGESFEDEFCLWEIMENLNEKKYWIIDGAIYKWRNMVLIPWKIFFFWVEIF